MKNSIVKLKLKNTEGVEKTVSVHACNPQVKVLKEGFTYRLGHLTKLASGETLTKEELVDSPALTDVSKETAVTMVEEYFLAASKDIVEYKKAKDEADV